MMTFFHLAHGVLVFAVLASQQLPAHGKPFGTGVRVCPKLQLSYQGVPKLSLDEVRKRMRETINGCQYVNGDVEINNFGTTNAGRDSLGEDFQQLRTDFLDSIEEIAGLLILRDVNLAVLEFKNLRVIRGMWHKHRRGEAGLAIDIMNIRWPLSLRLPQLTAIESGSVRLSGPMHWNIVGYLAHRVNWGLLFQDRGNRTEKQQFQNYAIAMGCATGDCTGKAAPACSKECSACWSGGSEGCQSEPRTKYSGCHRGCLGGCNREGDPRGCHSCVGFNRDGACSDSCSQQGADSQHLLPMLNRLCMSSCPLPFLRRVESRTQESCVEMCADFEMPVRGACESCVKCGRVCDVDSVSPVKDNVARKLLGDGCKLLSAFNTLDVGNRVFQQGASLMFLTDVRAFYGSLMINGVDRLGVSRIDFLKSLEFVFGSLTMFRMKVRYLGLARLRYTSVLFLMDISGLCSAWYPEKHLTRLTKSLRIINVTFDNSSAECQDAKCHSVCGNKACWGPTADMCVEDTWIQQ